MNLPVPALAALSYLAGAVPSGYLIARQAKGIDIREFGSGNPGAANVYRVVGRGAGFATLVGDAMKGFLPICLTRHFAPNRHDVLILCGSLAILGHVWTVFLKFRGGKAVATSGGVFAALSPAPLSAAAGVFAAGLILSGHISVGSMAGAVAFPFFMLAFGAPKHLVLMSFGASALILIRHIPNLRRLLRGVELSRSRLENRGKIQ